MTDTERLNWLEQQDGAALVNDDYGHWAVAFDGTQNCLDNPPGDVTTSFWIQKEKWKDSIREAIDAAIEEDEL